MADVAQEAVPEATPEDRLAAYFGGGQPAQEEPSAPEAEADSGVEQQLEAPEEGDEQAQPESGEEPYEELEHLGKAYKVPASLKKAFEENRSAYTKYSTEAKALEARQAQIAAQAQLIEAESQFQKYAEAEINEKARLEALLSQYKKLDWYQMTPEQYAENRRNRDIIAEQLEDTKGSLGKKHDEYSQWRKGQMEQMVAKGMEYLSKTIPGYENEETRARIAQQGFQLGFTKAELESSVDPRLFVALHKAAQWDRLQASKPQVANKAAKAAPIVRSASNAAQPSTQQAAYRDVRSSLKKTGSVSDAARLLSMRRFK